MLGILKNELVKVAKSKRIAIFTGIILTLCAFFGIVVVQMEKTGMATDEMIQEMAGGNFPIQMLGLVSDMVLPIFATLLACFLLIDEYNSGTLKLPILCGHSRNSIITAKMLAVISIMAYIMTMIWLGANLTSVILWGADGVIQMLGSNLLIYVQTFIAMVSWSLIMMLVALFLKNSGIMIGIMTVILVVSSVVGSMFPSIARYIITYYLKAFASQSGTVSYALGDMVCLSMLAIFGAAAYLRFNLMEIQK